jgi:hypothetical protein
MAALGPDGQGVAIQLTDLALTCGAMGGIFRRRRR